MRINKVKVTKEGKIAIEYQILKGGSNYDDYSLKCSEKALGSFYAAIYAFRESVVKLCELPEEFTERIVVKGVTFSYGGERETMGAVIVAQLILNLSDGNLNLNTPHKAVEMYNEDSEPREEAVFDEDTIGCLEQLEKEAVKYVNGERAQGSLL
jgi:hypothetical protein